MRLATWWAALNAGVALSRECDDPGEGSREVDCGEDAHADASLSGVDGAGGLGDEDDASRSRAVSKVVSVLQDMLRQLEREAREDEKVYEEVACWCETSRKEKLRAIRDAKSRMNVLEKEIPELKSLSAHVAAEVDDAKKEVADNKASLDKAIEIRKKQSTSFKKEEADLLQSISAIKGALATMSKSQNRTFLQTSPNREVGIAASLVHELQKHPAFLKVLPPMLRGEALTVMNSPKEYVRAAIASKRLSTSQPNGIPGILGQLKTAFETHLSSARKEEEENQKAFLDVRRTKEAEIRAGQDRVASKAEELAGTDQQKARAREDLGDTKAALAVDERFITMIHTKCGAADSEWDGRQKTRQLEIEACSKAVGVLSGDSVQELFANSAGAEFLQVRRAMRSRRRSEASQLLSISARRFRSSRLASLALLSRSDAFARVEKAIDNMVSQLLEEKAANIKHKDFCDDEFQTNQLQLDAKVREKEGWLAKIEGLNEVGKQLSGELKSLEQEINDMRDQLTRAGEDRERENNEFQKVIAEKRLEQQVLNTAIGILEDVVADSGDAPALIQVDRQIAGMPSLPVTFKLYQSSVRSSGITDMIQRILHDSKAMEAKTIRAEEEVQKMYEELVKETNDSIKTKSEEVTNKSDEKSKIDVELMKMKKSAEGVITEFDELENYQSKLHDSCDVLLRNFQARQKARDQEVGVLRQAKDVLSGAAVSQAA